MHVRRHMSTVLSMLAWPADWFPNVSALSRAWIWASFSLLVWPSIPVSLYLLVCAYLPVYYFIFLCSMFLAICLSVICFYPSVSLPSSVYWSDHPCPIVSSYLSTCVHMCLSFNLSLSCISWTVWSGLAVCICLARTLCVHMHRLRFFF